jgi:hypothetical protein
MERRSQFSKVNYLLFLLGVALLVIGFLLSGMGPHDGFVSLTLSPLLLAIAYIGVLPAAILVRSKGD